MDEGGDDQARADHQRGEDLAAEMPARSASTSSATRSVHIGSRRTADGTWARARPRRACNDSRRRSASCWCPPTYEPWDGSVRSAEQHRCAAGRTTSATGRPRARTARRLVRLSTGARLPRATAQGAGRGTARFSYRRGHGELGLDPPRALASTDVPPWACGEASRRAGCRKSARPVR